MSVHEASVCDSLANSRIVAEIRDEGNDFLWLQLLEDLSCTEYAFHQHHAQRTKEVESLRGIMVAVICEAATGAMALTWMLYFAPSLANDFVKPVIPIFAAE